ncbi:hypothetical protein HYY75_03525 [bacterium]|nr:hypothetical protein [bacterium]
MIFQRNRNSEFKPKIVFVSGFGFVEILIAIFIAAVCGVPVFYLVTSTRTETSKAINYLRALELANEGFEWANIIQFGDKTQTDEAKINNMLSQFNGSLYQNKVRVGSNNLWTSQNEDIPYSEQYNNAFFYRTISISKVENSGDVKYGDFLRKITVTVSWSEGKTPKNPDQPDERSRILVLSGLLFNDQRLIY